MKKLMLVTALVASVAAFADGPINAISFEGYDLTLQDLTVGNKVDQLEQGGNGNAYFCYDGGTDGSTVKSYGGDNLVAPSSNKRPAYFAQDNNDNYLELNTEGGTLWRSINVADSSGSTYLLGAATNVAANGTYLDTLVQFTPTEDGNPPEVNGADKLAIWLNVDSSGGTSVTNLMVLAKTYVVDTENNVLTASVVTNSLVVQGITITDKEWYRLTIKAIPNLLKTEDYGKVLGFQIFINGQPAKNTAGQTFNANEFATYEMITEEMRGYMTEGSVFASLAALGNSTLQGVGFKGSGALDDIVWTEENPLASVALDFTLTWPAGVTPVSYTIGNGDGVAFAGTETSPLHINGVMSGDTVTFSFQNADGATKTMSLEAAAGATDIDASTAVYEWADYLGAAVNGAYTIDDANDLDMLRKGVDAGIATSNETFRQTANIDMSQAGAFAGIGAVGAENGTTLTMTAFEGTYDGGNYTISNLTFTNRKGSGLFNLIRGATIKDLVVDTVSYEAAFATSKLGGAMIVGNGVGCTLQHLITSGTNGSGNPSTYNAAGIANRLELRGGDILVVGCTNSAAIYSVYTKVAGICAIVECENATGSITFLDCANTGNIVANGTAAQIANNGGKTPGADGAAGILAYSQHAGTISLTNCVSTGTIEGAEGATIGSIIGKTSTSGITIVGGSAKADYQSVNSGATNVSGAKFATVDNGVATFVADDALALNGSYKVMSGNATATFVFTDLGTISFDEALSTPTYAITSSGAAGYPVASTSGTVTTYTVGYFPRTATAGQNGSAANPFELADADDLQALKTAFAANAAYKAYNYKVVNNIDATDLGYWDGIGTQGTADSGFKGVLDGGGYTISNLKFSAGKYRAFFNRMDGATIKDLTINVTDIQASGDEYGYAAFVGNMDSSKLLNCTATGTIGTTAKPAMHTCGGLAVKVNSAGVFVDCTNRINIVCALPDNPKVGGIVGLAQGAALTNCWNEGNLTIATLTCTNAANGVAGLVGYVQTRAVTIFGGGNVGTVQKTDDVGLPAAYNVPWKKDVNVASIIVKSSAAVTVSGGTVAQANMASVATRTNISGLDFATVDNNVATFVSDIESNNTYKVMSAGPTATYAFQAPGTIAFDTNLFQNVTFAITAAEGLAMTTNTADGVVTFAAGAPAPAYPTYLETADQTIKDKYDTWMGLYGADTESAYEAAFLLNADPQHLPVGAAFLKIASITQVEGGWELEIVSDATTLTATSNNSGLVGNGYLAIKYASDLAGLTSGGTLVNLPVTVTSGKITVTVTAEGAKFMKATLSTTPVVQN